MNYKLQKYLIMYCPEVVVDNSHLSKVLII